LVATTTEQGDYVLEDVVPGEYYVIALPRNSAVDLLGQPNRHGHANTFHPNAARVSDAARVRVTMGRAIATITLAPAKLAYVSGVVMGESGQPVKGGRWVLLAVTDSSAWYPQRSACGLMACSPWAAFRLAPTIFITAKARGRRRAASPQKSR
jgi:hypothetical protein